MIDFLTASANAPFTVALLLMLMIGAVEALGLGLGSVELDLDADGHGLGGDFLDWLGVGRVPLLILLVVLLALFGILGIAIQQLASGLLGAPLSPWIAAPAALIASLPLTGSAAGGLARIMPRDETTAVPIESLLGKRGTITVGTARRGSPAQARVRDIHGQTHHVMVEPHDDDAAYAEGETVLLVRREGSIFIGLGEAHGLTPHANAGI